MKQVLLALTLLVLAACSKVPAGNVGVKVDMYGSSKGVQTQELQPGRYWIGWNQELFLFPTFTQTYTWTKAVDENSPNDESITFGTDEGMSVNADVGITYHVDPDKVSVLFQKYRKGIDEITDTYLRNMVRDSLVNEASKLPIETVYGVGKADLIKKVQDDVTQQVSAYGIVIEKVYWIGELRLPESVVNSINAKIQATQNAQKAENEVALAKAEAQKVEAAAEGNAQATLTQATADAKAIQMKGDAIRSNPEVIQLNAIDKWDGKLPTYSGSGATPFLNVSK
jgi:regulator of protease activity HflC (stomatin/prohibitin superfamily)